MTTTADLVQAVVRDPLSTALRLVTADLLDEEGDHARAEFIRLQCRIAEMDEYVNAWASVPGRAADAGRAGRMKAEADALRRRVNELWGYQPAKKGIMRQIADSLPKGFAVLLDGDDGKGLTHDYPWATVRRGFVETITITEADFLGSPCGRCEGKGTVDPRMLEVNRENSGRMFQLGGTCSACAGTGRVGGHGPALVAAAPLTSVTLAGKEPRVWQEADEPVRWMWCRRSEWSRMESPSVIADELILAMSPWGYCHDTGEQAMTALSRAAIAWARERAGLPALVWPEGER